MEQKMRVGLFPPESVTEPRLWVRHDQAFAMMLGPGSIEWGSRRSAMEKFDYAAGDLALCDRHQGEWFGLMNTPHLQIGISEAALMTASDGANGEVGPRPQRKFADSRLGAPVAAVHTEVIAGYPSGQLFVDSVEQANVFPIAVPPPRERTEDIPLLVEYFVGRYANTAAGLRAEDHRQARFGNSV